MLGIRGTFIFTGIVFFLADICFGVYFYQNNQLANFLILQLFLLPTLVYFNKWAFEAWKDAGKADFDRTMLLNKLSSLSMISFFALITFLKFF